jgi:hypothetical protein
MLRPTLSALVTFSVTNALSRELATDQDPVLTEEIPAPIELVEVAPLTGPAVADSEKPVLVDTGVEVAPVDKSVPATEVVPQAELSIIFDPTPKAKEELPTQPPVIIEHQLEVESKTEGAAEPVTEVEESTPNLPVFVDSAPEKAPEAPD